MTAPRETPGAAKPASAIVEDLLRMLRGKFYADRDEKRWHWERELLVKAITHPAWVLSKRGAELPADQYQAILLKIVATIQRHGSPDAARNFGRYFFASVQSHMRLHWEEYHDAAKSLRLNVEKATAATKAEARAGSPVSALAEAHRALLKPAAGRPKKQAIPAAQPELF